MAPNVHNFRNLTLFLSYFQIYCWSLQAYFSCTAAHLLLCTEEISNDSNMQWISSFCRVCFPFWQPLNYIPPSFQVHHRWNQIILCIGPVVWHHLEGTKQGLCWARSISNVWAKYFMTTNNIIKSHGNTGKAFPCVQESELKNSQISSTLRTRDSPPARCMNMANTGFTSAWT